MPKHLADTLGLQEAACTAAAAVAEEYLIGIKPSGAGRGISLDYGVDFIGERYKTTLPSLAECYSEHAGVAVNVAEPKGEELADAQSSTEQEADNQAVSVVYPAGERPVGNRFLQFQVLLEADLGAVFFDLPAPGLNTPGNCPPYSAASAR